MAIANRLRLTWESEPLMSAIAANRTAIPIAVSRTVDTRSMYFGRPTRANLTSAGGSSNSMMKSMIVGSASGTFVHAPVKLRN